LLFIFLRIDAGRRQKSLRQFWRTWMVKHSGIIDVWWALANN
jgi:hypothetical protein